MNTQWTTDGTTALMLASQNGHTEIVCLLLNHKADINKQRTTDHMTAFMIASQNGHTEIVHFLLEHGADVKAKISDGTTAFMFASQNGHIEIVRLLHSYTADVNAQRTIKMVLLHSCMLASVFGQTKTFHLLLSYKAAVNSCMVLLHSYMQPVLVSLKLFVSSSMMEHQLLICSTSCLQHAKNVMCATTFSKIRTSHACLLLKEEIDIPMSPAILSMLLSADANLNFQAKDGKRALMQHTLDTKNVSRFYSMLELTLMYRTQRMPQLFMLQLMRDTVKSQNCC